MTQGGEFPHGGAFAAESRGQLSTTRKLSTLAARPSATLRDHGIRWPLISGPNLLPWLALNFVRLTLIRWYLTTDKPCRPGTSRPGARRPAPTRPALSAAQRIQTKINLSSTALHDHGDFSPDGDLAVIYAENSPSGENLPLKIGHKTLVFMITATFQCRNG
jgi:hypothetical protein